MYSSLRLRTARSGRYPEFGGRPVLGDVNVQYEGKKTPVPELSAIWSESTIGGSAIGGSTVYMKGSFRKTQNLLEATLGYVLSKCRIIWLQICRKTPYSWVIGHLERNIIKTVP